MHGNDAYTRHLTHFLNHLTPCGHGGLCCPQVYLLLPCSQNRAGEHVMHLSLIRPCAQASQVGHEPLRCLCPHNMEAKGRHSLSLQILRGLLCLQ